MKTVKIKSAKHKIVKRPDFKDLRGEDFYVDEEDEYWGVFDTKVGFCWGLHPRKNKAEDQVKELKLALKRK